MGVGVGNPMRGSMDAGSSLEEGMEERRRRCKGSRGTKNMVMGFPESRCFNLKTPQDSVVCSSSLPSLVGIVFGGRREGYRGSLGYLYGERQGENQVDEPADAREIVNDSRSWNYMQYLLARKETLFVN
eukprot:753216-Hanusia_phi.AAC.5